MLKVKVALLAILLVLSVSTGSLAAVVDGEDYVLVPAMADIEEPETYTVIEGDNLYRIALAHDVPLDTLMEWNGLEGDLIHPGDVLLISETEAEHGIALNDSGSAAIETITDLAISQRPVVEETQKPERPVPVKPQAVAVKTPAPSKPAPVVSAPPAQEGVEMTMTATAYTAYCNGCSGTTAYGIDLRANPNQKVIAVDPRVIPLGTKVWIEGYGTAIAGDTGGAIKGNKIDVFIPSYENAMAWGVKKVKIRVLN